jgi:Fe2+ transport system protein FeoA
LKSKTTFSKVVGVDGSIGKVSSKLRDLSVGKSGIVRRVAGGRVQSVRLMEMGLVPGTLVTVERLAPLGDPMLLSVRGYTLSIRGTEAAEIEIERIGPEP